MGAAVFMTFRLMVQLLACHAHSHRFARAPKFFAAFQALNDAAIFAADAHSMTPINSCSHRFRIPQMNLPAPAAFPAKMTGQS
jgi:hypothetical protein